MQLLLGVVVVHLQGLSFLLRCIQPVLQTRHMRLGRVQDERFIFSHLAVHAQHLRVQAPTPFIDQSFARHLELLQLRSHACNVLVVQLQPGSLRNQLVRGKVAHLVNLGLQREDFLVLNHQRLLTRDDHGVFFTAHFTAGAQRTAAPYDPVPHNACLSPRLLGTHLRLAAQRLLIGDLPFQHFERLLLLLTMDAVALVHVALGHRVGDRCRELRILVVVIDRDKV